MSATSIIRLVPVLLSMYFSFATFRFGLGKVNGTDRFYSYSQPMDGTSLWITFIAVMLVLAAMGAWIVYSELKPTKVEPGQLSMQLGGAMVIEILCALGAVMMFGLGFSSMIDGATRHGGVGMFVGLLCAPWGFFFLIYRRWVIIDPQNRTLKMLFGRPRAIRTTAVPFEAVSNIEIVQVVNQYGHTRAWRVQANLKNGRKPIVLHASFGEQPAVDAAAQARAAIFG
jgi:hypothetical protein